MYIMYVFAYLMRRMCLVHFTVYVYSYVYHLLVCMHPCMSKKVSVNQVAVATARQFLRKAPYPEPFISVLE